MKRMHPQDAARERLRTDAVAVKFADDAKLDACRAYLSGQISVEAYREVASAHFEVRHIHRTGMRAVEST